MFDWCSPAMVRRSRRHPALSRTRDTSVVFRWGLRRPADIAGTDARWQVAEESNAPMVGAGWMPAIIGAVHRLVTGGREFYGCAHLRTGGVAGGTIGGTS